MEAIWLNLIWVSLPKYEGQHLRILSALPTVANSSLLTDAERERPEVDREHGFDQASLLTTEDACPHRNIELQGAARGKYY